MSGKQVKILFFLAILVLGGVFLYGPITRKIQAGRFSDRLAEYAALDSGAGGDGGELRRVGKMFILKKLLPEPGLVGTVTNYPPEIHPAWYDLPAEMRALSPDEVGTLVVAIPRPKIVVFERVGSAPLPGMSGDRMQRARKDVEIRLIDLREKKLIGSHTVEGEAPPEFFQADAQKQREITLAERQDTDILPFLTGLPAR